MCLPLLLIFSAKKSKPSGQQAGAAARSLGVGRTERSSEPEFQIYPSVSSPALLFEFRLIVSLAEQPRDFPSGEMKGHDPFLTRVPC